MNADSIVAIVTAVTALVAALGGFVTVLVKLKSGATAQAATSAKVDAIHAATVEQPAGDKPSILTCTALQTNVPVIGGPSGGVLFITNAAGAPALVFTGPGLFGSEKRVTCNPNTQLLNLSALDVPAGQTLRVDLDAAGKRRQATPRSVR